MLNETSEKELVPKTLIINKVTLEKIELMFKVITKQDLIALTMIIILLKGIQILTQVVQVLELEIIHLMLIIMEVVILSIKDLEEGNIITTVMEIKSMFLKGK